MQGEGNVERIRAGRDFMKSHFGAEGGQSDQQRGLPQPVLAKPALTESCTRLPRDFDGLLKQSDYTALLRARRSRRVFTQEAISIHQLSYLLWSTQGIEELAGRRQVTLRPVPSGGARHPFETYITVRSVDGLLPGLYHYLPLEHSLELLRAMPDYQDEVTCALMGQSWAALAACVLFWTCVPYRSEWRYSTSSHHIMLIDMGHVGQNAYLSAEALGLGTCCIGAYDQAECDALLGVDGEEEYTLYAAPVGVEKQGLGQKLVNIALK